MATDWSEDDSIAATFPSLRIVAGISLLDPWLETLALDHSEQLALRWLQGRSRTDAVTVGDLLKVTWKQMMKWPQVGPHRRELMMLFLEKASTEAASLNVRISTGEAGIGVVATSEHERDPAGADDRASESSESLTPVPPARGHIGPAREWVRAIDDLTAWAATVSGGATWGHIIGLSERELPVDLESAWRIFVNAPAPVGSQASAQDVIADGLDSLLSAAEYRILFDRVIGPTRRTLDDLGAEFGFTRERARQIEIKARSLVVRHFTDSESWRPVRWAVDAFRSSLGSMARVQLRDSVLLGLGSEGMEVVTWLAGYRRAGDFLVVEGFMPPTLSELPRTTPDGLVIDELKTIETMTAAGVLPRHLDDALASIDGLNRIDGILVDWSGSQVDRAIAVLEVRDEAQELDELFAMAGGGSLVSFRNRVFESDRIMRVTKTKVGLRSWGGTHYTSIADLMKQRLSSGPMEIQALATELARTYEVSANSVMMYSYAPAFKVTGDMVAIRRRDDSYVPRNKPQAVEGLFQIDPDTIYWHVDVDDDVLRGSGRSLPQEVGAFLGVVAGDEPFVLRNSVEDVQVGWPETSITGPNIGSMRRLAGSVQAEVGDTLRLEFHLGNRDLGVVLVPREASGESPADTLSRLTGLSVDECHDLRALASMIDVAEDDVIDALRKRKDLRIAMAAEVVRRAE